MTLPIRAGDEGNISKHTRKGHFPILRCTGLFIVMGILLYSHSGLNLTMALIGSTSDPSVVVDKATDFVLSHNYLIDPVHLGAQVIDESKIPFHAPACGKMIHPPKEALTRVHRYSPQ